MLFWFGAAALALQPHGDAPAALSCASARVPQAHAEAIGSAFRDGGDLSEAHLEQVADAVVACTIDDPGLRRSLVTGVVADLARASLRRQLAMEGLDMDLVDRLFDELPAELRTSGANMQENVTPFVQSLLEQGMDANLLMAHGGALGVYLGSRVGVTRARLGLPGS